MTSIWAITSGSSYPAQVYREQLTEQLVARQQVQDPTANELANTLQAENPAPKPVIAPENAGWVGMVLDKMV